MKKWTLFFWSVVVVVLMQNCSNDFELTENWKDITIVYGLLDASDTAQYIRIEKAFLDEKTSALVLAQEPDSLFYENLDVQLQEIPLQGGAGAFYKLDRVDANLEGYQKEGTLFANSPNYVYKLDRPINGSSRYKLLIQKQNDNEEITAETKVIGEVSLSFPLQANYLFNFGSNKKQSFRWNNDGTAFFYDLILRIHLTEAPKSNPTDTTPVVLDWTVESGIEPEEGLTLVLHEIEDGAEFYKFLQRSLETNSNIERKLDRIDVIVRAGGEDLYNYINVGKASAGVTSAETLPAYSNIDDGIGLFSSRYSKESRGFGFTAAMQDTLKDGPYTRELGF